MPFRLSSIAGAGETLVAMQRLVAGHARGEQKAFDPVDVVHALVRQRHALTRDAATILLIGVWEVRSIEHTVARPLVGQQRPDQLQQHHQRAIAAPVSKFEEPSARQKQDYCRDFLEL